MRLLFGEHELTIDDKNRFILPAAIRRMIDTEKDGEALFLVFGVNGVPWLYPEKYYERLALQQHNELAPEDDLIAFDQLNFGMTDLLSWDKQGRMLLPEQWVNDAAIEREVTLVGVRDHLELWNRDAWRQRKKELADQREAIAVRARQARSRVAPVVSENQQQ